MHWYLTECTTRHSPGPGVDAPTPIAEALVPKGGMPPITPLAQEWIGPCPQRAYTPRSTRKLDRHAGFARPHVSHFLGLLIRHVCSTYMWGMAAGTYAIGMLTAGFRHVGLGMVAPARCVAWGTAYHSSGLFASLLGMLTHAGPAFQIGTHAPSECPACSLGFLLGC